ncbi:MAG TPA: class I SAM-dependent RNA methyltransferase [Spirochaetota bacterium]|nr:class I SAM-dependent RNA methyltransferase [Spirochaetota bacterium]HPR46876.1 class I SAM-dependent RNA methyltransferase [Spirochaetota bacterium]
MNDFLITATCAFGLESVLKRELFLLGYRETAAENGKVSFHGSSDDLARCNLRLRSADRVFITLAEFDAVDYDQFYDATARLKWEEMIPEHGMVAVTARSKGSAIAGVPRAQAVAKKAVLDAMRRRFPRDRFEESGPQYHIDIAIHKDRVTVNLDTSGAGLHKRGYRTEKGEAPLRETLAAALVLLSRWKHELPLADPLCGSGTIAIEAALIGINRAPGLYRKFSAESWPFIPASAWQRAREEARDSETPGPVNIYASDHDRRVFSVARDNAARAGVSGHILFERKDVREFSSKDKNGFIITNPPYGERLGEKDEVEALYRDMGAVLSRLDSWSLFILTGHERFERIFGRKADRNRKLYNGPIKTYLYQYTAPAVTGKSY